MQLLGIGSNLPSSFGDRFKNIDLTISNLESNKIKIIKKSSFYETPSYPDLKNPKFINIVVGINSNLLPEELASVLISIEEKLERRRKIKNEPRTCDIDIIDFKSRVLSFYINNNSIEIPHISLSNRNFVLIPLFEINKKEPRHLFQFSPISSWCCLKSSSFSILFSCS